jgi:hypothetical protein
MSAPRSRYASIFVRHSYPYVLNGVVAQIARQVPWHRRFNFIRDVAIETDDWR